MSQPWQAEPTPDEILGYYARGGEDARLVQDAEGLLEQARTEELLQRFLPPAPELVLDVGGGTGRYATWLAERGYEVQLIDPVPLHIEQAHRQSVRAARQLASARLGEARTGRTRRLRGCRLVAGTAVSPDPSRRPA